MKKFLLPFIVLLLAIMSVISMSSCDVLGSSFDVDSDEDVEETLLYKYELNELIEAYERLEKKQNCKHNYDDPHTVVEPSCTSIGYIQSYCTSCGYEKTEFLNAYGHKFEDSYSINASDGSGVLEVKSCIICSSAQIELAKFSTGLEYEKTAHEEYRVVGIGTCDDEHIVIPEQYDGLPVTEIGERAFFGCSIISIKLPNSIVKIYDKAFSECEELSNIIMSDNIDIGTDVFRGSINVEIEIQHELVYVPAKDASCHNPGNIAYYWCESCNMYYADENGTTRIYEVAIPNSHNFVDGVCTSCAQIQSEVLICYVSSVPHLGKFALGTLENAIGLPKQINVRTYDGVTHALDVEWNLSDYDKSKAGKYTIQGFIQPGSLYFDDELTNEITATIEIVDFMNGTADIIFVLDISGSMGDEIRNVKDNVIEFAQAIEEMGVSARWAAVTYSDYVEYPTHDNEQTTIIYNGAHEWFSSAEDYKNAFNRIYLANGGDDPETAIDGLMLANTLSTRKDARTFYILLTDASYKTNNHYGVSSLDGAAEILNNESVNVSVITSSSLYSTYSALTSMTGGISSNINGNFSQDLLNELVPIIYADVIS